MDVSDVEEILYDELMRWFGPGVIDPTIDVHRCAEGIWGVWEERARALGRGSE